jgi:outer membrane receptor protein involved in Fe transport
MIGPVSARRCPRGYAALAATVALITVPAHAQTASSGDAPAGSEIVITGSRISRPDLSASSPVAVIEAGALKSNNAVTVEQILQVNPQFQPGENSAENNPGLGVATIDLRGLGDNRTLVLIDGKRAPYFDTSGAVDVNSIPTALIKRVDILTGGASAVYGSDAVSGVVNFVLDDRFTGLRADASSQISGYGDGGTHDASLTGGVKFGDRGNLVVSGNYSKRDGVFFGARSRNATSLNSDDLSFSGSSNTYPTAFDIPGAGRQQVTQTGALTSSVLGYNTNPTNYVQTPLERYGVMALGRYEVANGIEVYGRGNYSHVEVQTQLAPTATAGYAFDIHPDNPLLTAAERAAFFNKTANPNLVINRDGSSTVGIRRRIIETGGRLEDHVNKSWQMVGGVRGDISSSLHFDVSGQYGEVKRAETLKNDLSYTALQNALDVVSGPGGSPICRSTLTSPGNGCVPFNLFSYSGITPQALSYVQRDATQNSKSTQFILSGNLSGDIGFLQSPFADGPAAFSLGAEYRREKASTVVDPLFASGDLIYYGQGQSVTGKYNTKELYGELKMPLVQDKRFIHSLNVEGGFRYSDYSTVGSVYTYKAGGDYSPVDGIRFRGIYNRTVRAPNIYELYSPLVSGTTSIPRDPCVGTGVSAQVQAICIAQGAPRSAFNGTTSTVPAPILGQINGFFGGNPDLKAEKADTYTAGVVINPTRLRALTVSVDYYNIRIANAIDTVQASDVINQCYTGGNAAACGGIVRNPLDGSLSGNITYGVPVVYGNTSAIKTDGLDFSVGYHGGSPERFNYAFAYGGNYVLHYKKQSGASAQAYECAGHFGADCNMQPMAKYKHTTSLTLGYGAVAFTTRWRLIGKVSEDQDTDILVSKIKAFNYFDETVSVTVTSKVQLRVGVQNAFDKKPPIVGDTVGDVTNFGSTYPQVYDVIGRTFFAGVSVAM